MMTSLRKIALTINALLTLFVGIFLVWYVESRESVAYILKNKVILDNNNKYNIKIVCDNFSGNGVLYDGLLYPDYAMMEVTEYQSTKTEGGGYGRSYKKNNIKYHDFGGIDGVAINEEEAVKSFAPINVTKGELMELILRKYSGLTGFRIVAQVDSVITIEYSDGDKFIRSSIDYRVVKYGSYCGLFSSTNFIVGGIKFWPYQIKEVFIDDFSGKEIFFNGWFWSRNLRFPALLIAIELIQWVLLCAYKYVRSINSRASRAGVFFYIMSLIAFSLGVCGDSRLAVAISSRAMSALFVFIVSILVWGSSLVSYVFF